MPGILYPLNFLFNYEEVYFLLLYVQQKIKFLEVVQWEQLTSLTGIPARE